MPVTRSTLLVALSLFFSLVLLARVAPAHDLAMDQVVLWPDPAHGVLRGQITFNPHITRKKDNGGRVALEQRVLAAVGDRIRIELDGKPCKPAFEVRELWVPAGPTVGDIVMLRCPLPPRPHDLRVFAGPSLAALVVSVETIDATGVPRSQSVMVQGGSFTPTYLFDETSPNWNEGGAGQFEPGGKAAQPPTDRGASGGSTASGAPRPVGGTGRFVGGTGRFVGEAGLGAQAARYLWLGLHHILPLGWDHVLFVAGLVLGCGLHLRPLLWELSAFTLAHTLTLALGALGLVVLPRGVVEPMIAFSIAYVAVENLMLRSERRHRIAIVFLFGLLHGQGFAGALVTAGLPRAAFVTALLCFNAGVELGQLVVVLILCAGLFVLRKPGFVERYAVRPGSLAIACIGLYLGFVRLFG